ncbi:MAG: ParB N-terminal domain-containing protein [Gammaproteobacteria bacterium]|nr:ParB N-terminal domain-containing protein [Gammaproteobacteria bacterium]
MTKPFPIECRDVDLHRLVLRYGQRHTSSARALAHLTHALETSGQLTPCLVVPDEKEALRDPEHREAERFVLLDGYRRIAALRHLGADTVWVEVWRCELREALLTALARAQNRPLAPLREAAWLRELAARYGLSRHELARRSGRCEMCRQRRAGARGARRARLRAAATAPR